MRPHPVSLVVETGAFLRIAAEAGAATLAVLRPTANRTTAMGLKIRDVMDKSFSSRGKANGARGYGPVTDLLSS
jgi:hypothetical protein